MDPARVMAMDRKEFEFLMFGLEWYRIKEKEAIDNAGH